jgi:hypothetical protein
VWAEAGGRGGEGGRGEERRGTCESARGVEVCALYVCERSVLCTGVAGPDHLLAKDGENNTCPRI